MEYVETHNVVDATLNLIERVRTECHDHPKALAIESGKNRVTYAELGRQADSISAMIRGTCCAPGEVIAVMLPDQVCPHRCYAGCATGGLYLCAAE